MIRSIKNPAKKLASITSNPIKATVTISKIPLIKKYCLNWSKAIPKLLVSLFSKANWKWLEATVNFVPKTIFIIPIITVGIANTNIVKLTDGKIKETILNPKDLGIKAKNFENIVGKDPGYNSEKIKEIFSGKDNDFSIAVCLNAAAGLQVAEKSMSFSDGYQNLRKHILSGKVINHISKLATWIIL